MIEANGPTEYRISHHNFGYSYHAASPSRVSLCPNFCQGESWVQAWLKERNVRMKEAKMVTPSMLYRISIEHILAMPLSPVTRLNSCVNLRSRRVTRPNMIGGTHCTYDRGKNGPTKHVTSHSKSGYSQYAAPPLLLI